MLALSSLALSSYVLVVALAGSEPVRVGPRVEVCSQDAALPVASRALILHAREELEQSVAELRAGDVETAGAALAEALASLGRVPERSHVSALELLASVDTQAVALGLWDVQLTARTWLVEGLEVAVAEDHPMLLRAQQHLAVLHHELGDLAAARELEEAVVLVRERTEPEDSEELLNARANLAVTARDQGELTRARELEEAVLEVRTRTRPETDPALLHARLNLARTMFEQGDLDGTLDLEQAALAAVADTLPRSHPEVLRARHNMAITLSTLGRIEEAERLVAEVLEVRLETQNRDDPEVLAARANLALALARTGRRQEAHEQLCEVLAARERALPSDHPAVLAARNRVANSLFGLGEHERAREMFTELLAVYERAFPADHALVLEGRLGLSVSLHALGRVEEACELQERVLAVYEQNLPGDHPALLNVRENLAIAQLDLGKAIEARDLLSDVVAARERTLAADHPDLLSARTHLASAMKHLGDLEGARALQEAVLAGFERTRTERDLDLHRARSNLAATLLELSERERAEQLLQKSLAGFEALLPPGHPDLLRVRLLVAVATEELGHAQEAYGAVAAAFAEALPPGHPDLLAATMNLARAHRDAGELERARSVAERVAAERRELLPLGHQDRIEVELELALLAWMRQDPERRADALAQVHRGELARLEAALVESPREARSMAHQTGRRLGAVLALSDLAHPGTALDLFRLFETRRHLATVGVGPRVAAGDAAEALRRDAAAATRRLARRVQSGPREQESIDEWRTAILTEAHARDRAQQALLDALEREQGFVRSIDAERLVPTLGPGVALAGYHVVRRWVLAQGVTTYTVAAPSLMALVLRHDGSVVRVELGSLEELEMLVDGWRSAVGAPTRRGVRPTIERASEERAGRRLRERIWDPVVEAAGEVAALHVALDGLLHLVPLDALPEDGGGRVGDRVRVHNELSFARLLAPPAAASTRSAELLLVGDVDFDAGYEASEAGSTPERGAARRWERLFGTLGEVEALSVMFDERFDDTEPALLSRAAATSAALREAVVGRRFVHIATHGWFAPESIFSLTESRDAESSAAGAARAVRGFAPLTLCGLALAGANDPAREDALLTAEELCGFDLSACELAVLSACETNVGLHRAGEGLLSLQTALQSAGARTTVTSLWRVDDALTQRLMRAFYTNLWTRGMAPADALWSAKVALREQGFPVSAWAGWVLSGCPE